MNGNAERHVLTGNFHWRGEDEPLHMIVFSTRLAVHDVALFNDRANGRYGLQEHMAFRIGGFGAAFTVEANLNAIFGDGGLAA